MIDKQFDNDMKMKLAQNQPNNTTISSISINLPFGKKPQIPLLNQTLGFKSQSKSFKHYFVQI